jgi:uncharacterized membrane protein YedE/YeeE
MFPIGINQYIIGGLIIGLGVSFVYIMTGIHSTQSSFFSSTISFFSKIPYFQQSTYLKSREWRLYFAVSVVLGAFLYTLLFSSEGFWITSISWWRLILGGFLAGLGTRISSGCTSGHGISGVASLSFTSVFAVITFISIGIITAHGMVFLGLAL